MENTLNNQAIVVEAVERVKKKIYLSVVQISKYKKPISFQDGFFLFNAGITNDCIV
jgi:hypothetical protein